MCVELSVRGRHGRDDKEGSLKIVRAFFLLPVVRI